MKIVNMRYQLQTIKKGNQSITYYLSKIRSIADSLRTAGEKLFDRELVIYVLGGLDLEYGSFVTTIATRDI